MKLFCSLRSGLAWQACLVLLATGLVCETLVQPAPAASATNPAAAPTFRPGALEELIFFTHPSTRTRIFNAMRWREQMLPPR